jgi:hypothetical protein
MITILGYGTLLLAVAVGFALLVYWVAQLLEAEVSPVATVLGTAIAVATLLGGLLTYHETSQLQNRAEAAAAFQSYAAMRVEHPHPKPRTKRRAAERHSRMDRGSRSFRRRDDLSRATR